MTRNHFKKTRVNQLKIKSITSLSNQRQRVMKDTYPYLSYKLRCYTRISGPEKSRNKNTRKNRKYFTGVWYHQSAADTSSPFASLCRVDEWKPLPFSILSLLSEFSRIIASKTRKTLCCFQTVTLDIFLKEKKTKVLKEKPKITYSVALLMAYLVAGESVQYLFIILNVI